MEHKKIKIIFFGTPDYVRPVLKNLAKRHEIVAVVTQPPKPTGRRQFLTYSPVDDWAFKRKIPVFRDFNKALPNSDLGVLAAYGQIVPPRVLDAFPHGILVIHPSLLPQFRCGAPIPATIITNTNPTGVSIFKMGPKFDQGPIITQFKEELLPTDTTETLRIRLFARSAEVLCDLIPAYMAGKIKPKNQDETKATYAKAQALTKENSFLPLEALKLAMVGKTFKEEWKIPFIENHQHIPLKVELTPTLIERFIRAMDPWPGTFTKIKIKNQEIKRLKILRAHLEKNQLVLDEVQLEGKNPVSWKQFKEAYRFVTF